MTTTLRDVLCYDGRNPDPKKQDLKIPAADLPKADGTYIAVPSALDLSVQYRRLRRVSREIDASYAGGARQVVCEPRIEQVNDNAAVVRLAQSRCSHPRVQVHLLGALTQGLRHEAISEMAALKSVGCVGVSDGGVAVDDSKLLRRALQYADSLDLPIFLTPVEPSLAADGCIHGGTVSARLGLSGVPIAAETAAIRRILALVEDTGARVHFARISAARSVDIIRHAKADGLPVTADISVHHLFATENDIGQFDARYHVHPPFRRVADRDGLRAGIMDGTIDAICSGHKPLTRDSRLAPFPATDSGIAGAQTLWPLAAAATEEGLNWHVVSRALGVTPYEILGLSPPEHAPMVVLDVDADRPIAEEDWLSSGHNSPFTDWRFRCRVVGYATP